MIKYPRIKHREFINFLNRELPTKNDIKLELLKGYSTIMINNEGDMAFAMYSPDEKTIYLPTKLDAEIEYTCLAHEYVHAWQDENDKSFDEEEAENKANALFVKFMKVG